MACYADDAGDSTGLPKSTDFYHCDVQNYNISETQSVSFHGRPAPR